MDEFLMLIIIIILQMQILLEYTLYLLQPAITDISDANKQAFRHVVACLRVYMLDDARVHA